MRAHLGTLRAPPYKYMGHPPCNLADKRVYIFQNSEGWQIYFDNNILQVAEQLKNTPKNPENKKAWELIKETGCDQYVEGDAVISKKHCNFFVNKGNAKSSYN